MSRYDSVPVIAQSLRNTNRYSVTFWIALLAIPGLVLFGIVSFATNVMFDREKELARWPAKSGQTVTLPAGNLNVYCEYKTGGPRETYKQTVEFQSIGNGAVISPTPPQWSWASTAWVRYGHFRTFLGTLAVEKAGTYTTGPLPAQKSIEDAELILKFPN